MSVQATSLAPTEVWKEGERFAAFDKLRAASMLFVLFWHSGRSFAPWPWVVKDEHPNFVATALLWFNTGYSMRVFFAMSGFFAAMLYARHGAAYLVKHRLQRILVPFLLFVPIYNWIVSFQTGAPVVYQPDHLWFLQYLILITLGAIQIAEARERFPRIGARTEAVLAKLVTTVWGAAVLGVLTVLALYAGGDSDGRDPSIVVPNTTFVPSGAVLAYYALFFGFGWMLFRNMQVVKTLEGRCFWLLGAAFGVRVLTAALVARPDQNGLPPEVTGLLARIVSALFSWLMVLGLIGLFCRYLNVDGRRSRYWSDAAYFFYLFHMIPVVQLQLLVSATSLPVLVKYLVVAGGGTAVCWIVYETSVRYTHVGALLNGWRFRERGVRSTPQEVPTSSVALRRSVAIRRPYRRGAR